MVHFNNNTYQCSMELTLSIIGGKWKVLILWHLKDNVLRFTELQKKLLYISPKMLTQQLRELEKSNLIERHSYNQIPPHVEYTLSPKGESIIPVLNDLNNWGVNYAENNGGIVRTDN